MIFIIDKTSQSLGVPWTYHRESDNLVSLHNLLPAVFLRQSVQQLLYRLVVYGLQSVTVEAELLMLSAEPGSNG